MIEGRTGYIISYQNLVENYNVQQAEYKQTFIISYQNLVENYNYLL